MQRLLDDMIYQRQRARRAERIEAAARLLAVVLLCLIAYSCSLHEVRV